MTDTPPLIDSARLASDVAKLTPETRRALYRRVFGSESGQLVLLDLLTKAGVGAIRPPAVTHEGRIHLDGQAWAVLNLMKDAGYGVADIGAVLISNSMRGLTPNERSSDFDPDPRSPGVRLPGDPAPGGAGLTPGDNEF